MGNICPSRLTSCSLCHQAPLLSLPSPPCRPTTGVGGTTATSTSTPTPSSTATQPTIMSGLPTAPTTTAIHASSPVPWIRNRTLRSTLRHGPVATPDSSPTNTPQMTEGGQQSPKCLSARGTHRRQAQQPHPATPTTMSPKLCPGPVARRRPAAQARTSKQSPASTAKSVPPQPPTGAAGIQPTPKAPDAPPQTHNLPPPTQRCQRQQPHQPMTTKPTQGAFSRNAAATLGKTGMGASCSYTQEERATAASVDKTKQ